jgi:hypothetical protein
MGVRAADLFLSVTPAQRWWKSRQASIPGRGSSCFRRIKSMTVYA